MGHALARYFAFCNFVWVHKTLRLSPAKSAGITDRLWSMEDIIVRIDADAPAPSAALTRSGVPDISD
jgi:hypothetical protein